MSDIVKEIGVEQPEGGRIGIINRNTNETKIALRLNVDGMGTYTVSTGIRFFDHMLESFAKHGGFDLELKCVGDLDVDQHHTVEDVGIALGEAFAQALAVLPTPTLAFCRTGTRCTMLWALDAVRRQPVEDVLHTATVAGYDLGGLRPRLQQAASC